MKTAAHAPLDAAATRGAERMDRCAALQDPPTPLPAATRSGTRQSDLWHSIPPEPPAENMSLPVSHVVSWHFLVPDRGNGHVHGPVRQSAASKLKCRAVRTSALSWRSRRSFVEWFFGMVGFRRVATHHDRTVGNFLSAVLLAASRLLHFRLANQPFEPNAKSRGDLRLSAFSALHRK